jgi:hypothetical protein
MRDRRPARASLVLGSGPQNTNQGAPDNGTYRGGVAGPLLNQCSLSHPNRDNVVVARHGIAKVLLVQVVLRKLGRGSRAVTGRLVRAPRKGSVVVIEFSDGMHEYVTTPVKRVLRLASRDVFYIETVNSRYRLEVRDRERTLEDASSG